jgi:6-pyruvoyl-tetrahydropterin synthase
MYTVSISTDISIVHRLHRAGGRSRFLHGHTWTVVVEVGTHCLSDHGIVVEFAPIKARVREQLVRHIDRHVLLAHDDPAITELAPYCGPEGPCVFAEAPTAEVLARHLYLIFETLVISLMGERAKYLKVTVKETDRLSASFDGI